MRKIKQEELNELLAKHLQYLNGDAEIGPLDLSFTDLTDLNMFGANMSYSIMRGAIMRDTDMRGVNISYADMSYADMSYSIMREANMSYSIMLGAIMRDTDMSDSIMRGTDMSYSIMLGAIMRGARFLDENQREYSPIQIVNTQFHITIFHDKVLWGCRIFSYEDIANLKFEDCTHFNNREEFNFNKKSIIDHINLYFLKAK